jgi:hypothetical protein
MPQDTIFGRALPMNQDRKKERLKEGGNPVSLSRKRIWGAIEAGTG